MTELVPQQLELIDPFEKVFKINDYNIQKDKERKRNHRHYHCLHILASFCPSKDRGESREPSFEEIALHST